MDILIIALLFLLCAILIAVEIFIIPGTSLAGIAAGICLIVANYMTFEL